MSNDDLILSLPLDGSIRDDGPYVLHQTSMNVQGESFVPGRDGQAISFEKDGMLEVIPPIVPIWQDFTLTGWFRVPPLAQTVSATWVLFRFIDEEGAEQFLYVDLLTPLRRWTFLAMVQEDRSLSIYVNNQLIERNDYPDGWGMPTGFCILNDNPHTGSGECQMDDLNVYWGAQPIDRIVIPPKIMKPILYSINDTLFSGYGVYVSASTGMIGGLARKEPLTANWDDHHGEFIDLSAPRYQPRDITLNCFITGVDKGEFVDRVQTFLSQFEKAGTQRLMMDLNDDETPPFVYEVYVRDAVDINKKWSKSRNFGTFELRLREPEPIKRVLRFSGSGEVSITLSSADPVNIYWGDKTHAKDVAGTNRTVKHTYATAGDHYIILTGILDKITAFSTTAQIVWNKL